LSNLHTFVADSQQPRADLLTGARIVNRRYCAIIPGFRRGR
jgi:hypothetical protein